MSNIAQYGDPDLKDLEQNGSNSKRVVSISAVIATRNRPEPLKRCLDSIQRQRTPIDEVVVIDSSDDDQTERLVAEGGRSLGIRVIYRRSQVRSAAVQRNEGAAIASGEYLMFLDDDVVLEEDYVEEIHRILLDPQQDDVGGVSGIIVNQSFVEPRGMNRLLLGLALGRWSGSYAGRLLGPAVNFLPSNSEGIREVDWLPSTCAVYRREVFLGYRFGSTFQGYSFAEDVHLSARIARQYRLLSLPSARVFHEDLGGSTHRDWAEIGHSIVMNRHLIMTSVMARSGWADYARLFYYEMFYSPLAFLNGGVSPERLRIAVNMIRGRWNAFRDLAAGRNVHARA